MPSSSNTKAKAVRLPLEARKAPKRSANTGGEENDQSPVIGHEPGDDLEEQLDQEAAERADKADGLELTAGGQRDGSQPTIATLSSEQKRLGESSKGD